MGERSGGYQGTSPRGGTGRFAGREDEERRDDRVLPKSGVPEVDPPLPDEISGAELDKDVRNELKTLGPHMARAAARHLVMAGQLIDDDPELAWRHAEAARRRGGRIGAVREAAGLTAYAAGHYESALAELRAARRLTGSPIHLPVMADSERGRGRPERALDLASTPEVKGLEWALQVEMLIVASGARTDMGQLDAAVVTLQIPELEETRRSAWLARLRTAYAEALYRAGRHDEADEWNQRAEDADPGDTPGVGLPPDDVDFVDLLEGEEEESQDETPLAGEVPGE